ncbi:MAG: hypothetical protein ABIE84_05025 [bacterium]
MLNGQNFTPNMPQLPQPPKLGQSLIQGQPQVAKEMQSKTDVQDGHKAVSWFTVEEKDGDFKLTAVPNTYQIDVTSVAIRPEEVQAPRTVSFLGYKIDISSKLSQFKESYTKNYALTKSHNLMVARFAQLKVACLGQMLSILGATSEELRKLQKQALGDASKQNRLLFDENEYNGELLAIVSGNKKQIKAQEKIIGEIRTQLITQANNLGMNDYYTRQRIIETQITQCKKILGKFQEEKVNLEYLVAYCGAN